MLADYHVHSDFSDDSFYPMEDVVRDAIAHGIDELCFTEHVDYGIKRDADDPRGPKVYPFSYEGMTDIPMANCDYPAYMAELARMREVYGDQIVIKQGLEFGIQRHTVSEYEALFHRYDFDFIIHSNHQVDDLEFWNGEYGEGMTQREYNLGYYEEILECMKLYKDYSVLGHLDAIRRYDPYGDTLDFKEIEDIIAEILKLAIADGKGIELNTSAERYKVGLFTPSDEIFRLYHNLGGEILTVGSDSHKPEHLGYHLKEAKEYLKSLGFKYYATYEKMKPQMHTL